MKIHVFFLGLAQIISILFQHILWLYFFSARAKAGGPCPCEKRVWEGHHCGGIVIATSDYFSPAVNPPFNNRAPVLIGAVVSSPAGVPAVLDRTKSDGPQ